MSKTIYENFGYPDLGLRRYTYEPLLSDNAVRVVVLHESPARDAPLHCSVIQYERSIELNSSDNSRHYSAVSYTWGKPEFSHLLFVSPLIDESQKNKMKQELNETYLPITPNVDALLRRFRKPYKLVYLWVDGICLNQEDRAEKGRQVPLMGEIYRAAKKVLIWLGSEEDHVKSADTFALIRRLSSDYKLKDQYERNSVTHLLDMPWFSRRWIIQEVALARRATLYWGSSSLDLTWLMQALPNMDQEVPGHPYAPQMLRAVVGKSGGDLGLLATLWKLDRSECSDPRDQIAALMGLATPDQRVTGDYENEDWMAFYQRVATHIINNCPELAHITIYHVFAFGSVSTIDGQNVNGAMCPSWVPNWSTRRRRLGTPLMRHSVRNKTGKTSQQAVSSTMSQLMASRFTGDHAPAATLERQKSYWEHEFLEANTLTGELIPDLKVKGNILQARWTSACGGPDGLVVQEVIQLPNDPRFEPWKATIEAIKPIQKRLKALYPEENSRWMIFGDPETPSHPARNLWRISLLLAYVLSFRENTDPGNMGIYSENMAICIKEALKRGMTYPSMLDVEQKHLLTKVGMLLSRFALLRLTEPRKRYSHQLDYNQIHPHEFDFALGPNETQVEDLLIPLSGGHSQLYERTSKDTSAKFRFAMPTCMETWMCVRRVPEVEFKPVQDGQQGPLRFRNVATGEIHSETPPREARLVGPALFIASVQIFAAREEMNRWRDTAKLWYIKERENGKRPMIVNII